MESHDERRDVISPSEPEWRAGGDLNGHNPLKRKRVAPKTVNPAACNECRQSKLRCEPSDDGGACCKRCTRLRLPCEKSAEFVRTSKSRRILDLEEQVKHLSNIVKPSVHESGPSPGSVLATTHAEYPSPINHVASRSLNVPPLENTIANVYTPGSLPHSVYDRPTARTTRTLGRLELEVDQIKSLVTLYFERFHPFLPLLDPDMSADQYYDKSPCLFWVIISIASRRFPEDVTLMTALTKPVIDMIWQSIRSPPYSIWIVTAVVLLSEWPFPAMTMNHGQVVTLSSIAITAARQLGIHRPKQAQDFTRPRTVLNAVEVQFRSKIWAALHVAAQSHCSEIGIMTPAPFDWTIDLACSLGNDYSLPHDLRFRLIIARFRYNVDLTLDQQNLDDVETSSRSDSHTWISSWDKELDALEAHLLYELSALDKINLSFARLYARATSLLDPADIAERRQDVVSAYYSAIDFISLSSQAFLPTTSDASTAGYAHQDVAYAPMSMASEIVTAAWIIFKVLRSNYASYIKNHSDGRKAFTTAVALSNRCSIENNDHPARATKMLGQIWHSESVEDSDLQAQGHPVLRVTSRLVASISFDFLFASREHIAKQNQKQQQNRDPDAAISQATTALKSTSTVPPQGLPIPQDTAMPFSNTSTFPSNMNTGMDFATSNFNFMGNNNFLNNDFGFDFWYDSTTGFTL